MIFKHISSLFTLGVQKEYSAEQARRITLLNKAILIMALPGIPYIILFFAYEKYKLCGLTSFFLMTYSISYYLNFKHRHTLAKLCMVIFTSLAVLIFNAILSPFAGIFFYYFSISALTFVLFDPKEKRLCALAFSIPSLCFIFEKLLKMPNILTIQLSSHMLHISYLLSASTSFILIYFSLKFFSDLILKSEATLLETNKKLETTLSETKKQQVMLEKTSQQTAFVTLTRGIAHEIRNPMAMILSGAELIIENIDDKKETLTYAEMVKKSILRLTKITSIMLKYGTFVDKKRELVDINKLLDDACLVANAECIKRKIKVIKHYSDIPRVNTNPDSLHQCFLNIILNGIQAIEKHGTITLSTKLNTEKKEKNYINIVISDTGKGISKDTLNKIFDPFFTTKYGNVGLGLSIVLKNIHELNGEIYADSISSPEKKTYFYISLPISGNPS